MTNENRVKYNLLADMETQGIIEHNTAVYMIDNEEREEFELYLGAYMSGYEKALEIAARKLPNDEDFEKSLYETEEE